MGCGGSRLNAEREAIPAKIRPMLHRRIEEIRRRRRSNRGKDTTPSGTELLLNHEDGTAKDDDDEIENSMASCVTSEDSKGFTAERAEAGDPQREESAKEKNKERENEEKAAKGNAEAESANVAKEDESHDNKEHDEGLHGNEDSIMFPGSPSFRIYFTDHLDEDDDDNDDDFNDGGKKDNGENREDKNHGTLPEKDSDPKKPKKGRKRRSFRKVIPKGGQTAMKNFFNVRSCYTPSCSSHDHAHLLTEKTPA